MTTQEKPSNPRKITLGWIAGWVLGVIIIVPAIATLVKQPIPGLALLAASLILLPPTMSFMQKKGNFHFSGPVKFIIVVILLAVAGGTMSKTQTTTTSGGNAMQQAPVQEAATQQQEAPKTYKEIFTFKGNGAKKSETFTITGDKFKIVYDCKGSFCSAWLKNPDSDLPLELVMNGTGPLKDESTFYRSGTFYIDVNAIGSYTMSVQDYK